MRLWDYQFYVLILTARFLHSALSFSFELVSNSLLISNIENIRFLINLYVLIFLSYYQIYRKVFTLAPTSRISQKHQPRLR